MVQNFGWNVPEALWHVFCAADYFPLFFMPICRGNNLVYTTRFRHRFEMQLALRHSKTFAKYVERS